jgi:hypothetical protein
MLYVLQSCINTKQYATSLICTMLLLLLLQIRIQPHLGCCLAAATAAASAIFMCTLPNRMAATYHHKKQQYYVVHETSNGEDQADEPLYHVFATTPYHTVFQPTK